MSRQRTLTITIGVMLSLFMASMEGTVVATAMPTIVSQLGGLDSYSWVFSVYMLTSTTTVPVYGKLSDIYGRRPIYLIAMILFLLGSVFCGSAQSMGTLIAARAVQGLGAGGILPLAFIMIGDMFTLEQRARMQGLFSGVWGVSSVIGPLMGGFLVDQVSWHWVFFVNVVPGLVALVLVWRAWVDKARNADTPQPSVDYFGAALLTGSLVVFLLGLFDFNQPLGWGLIALSLVLFGMLAWIESRAADPVLPLALFRERLFTIACIHGLMAGWAMFGSTSYVPLFVQSVLGTSATEAGATLTPMLIAWVLASIVGSRLLLRMGYRTLVLIGMVLLTIGSFLMTRVGVGTGPVLLLGSLSLMGIGMGLSIPSFLIAVQSTVHRAALGSATSTVQFSRSIGGTLGVSVMGAVLSAQLASGLLAAGLDPASVSIDALLDPVANASSNATLDSTLRIVLAGATQSVFWLAFGASVIGLIVVLFAPGGRIAQLASQRTEAESETTSHIAGISEM